MWIYRVKYTCKNHPVNYGASHYASERIFLSARNFMDNRIYYLITKTENRLKQFINKEFQKEMINISPPQMAVLFVLTEKNMLPMGDLSAILELDKSAITRLVDRLETAGFVTREMDPADRRQYKISITPSGTSEAARAKVLVDRINEKLLKNVSREDLEVFTRVLNSVLVIINS